MKITITGSVGNIGKSQTKELVQKEHQVMVISHSPKRCLSQVQKLRLVQWKM